MHGVIDNFSRKILAWRIVGRLDPGTTRAILEEAAGNLDDDALDPKVVTDSGVENVNSTVDELLATSVLTRVLALVEVTFSNSKIEAFWRPLRHGWLYLNELDSLAAVERLVGFYVEAHNTTPHSSFRGPTPDESYRGKADQVVVDLSETKKKARGARLTENRKRCCRGCAARRTPPDSTRIATDREEERAA